MVQVAQPAVPFNLAVKLVLNVNLGRPGFGMIVPAFPGWLTGANSSPTDSSRPLPPCNRRNNPKLFPDSDGPS